MHFQKFSSGSEILRTDTISQMKRTVFTINFDGIYLLQAMVSFHTYSQLIMYSYGYKTGEFPPNQKELHRVGMVAKQSIMKLTGKNYTVQGTADLYPAAGKDILSYFDWFIRLSH